MIKAKNLYKKKTIRYDEHTAELLTLHSHQPRPIAKKESNNISTQTECIYVRLLSIDEKRSKVFFNSFRALKYAICTCKYVANISGR